LVAATGLDFGYDSEFATDEMAAGLHERYPRLNTASALAAAITGPAKAPLASFTHYLLKTEKLGVDNDIVSRWGD
jgi:hypothetical protein